MHVLQVFYSINHIPSPLKHPREALKSLYVSSSFEEPTGKEAGRTEWVKEMGGGIIHGRNCRHTKVDSKQPFLMMI